MKDRLDQLRERALELLLGADVPHADAAGTVAELEVMHVELLLQQDELRESQRHASELAAYYRQLFFDAPLGFAVVTPEGRLVELNAEAGRLLGIVAEPPALPFDQFLVAAPGLSWRALSAEAAARRLTCEVDVRRLGGERLRCQLSLSAREGGQSFLVTLQDISGLRAAEAEQRIADERARLLLRGMPEGVLFVDRRTDRILQANDAMGAFLGTSAEALAGRPLASLFPPGDRVYQEVLLRQSTGRGEPMALRFEAAGGTTVTGEVTAGELKEGPARTLALLVRDLAPRLRLDAEREAVRTRAAEAQKLELVGRLAAGIAHDMNNMLSIVLAYTDPPPEAQDEMTEALAEIHTAALRGRELTSRLSTLFRRQPVRRQAFDLTQTVGELEALLRRTLPPRIALRVEISPGPFVVVGDQGAWHQAILNLALNARDAMPGDGELSLRLDIDPDGATLVVADTGEGMSPETIARVWEPFFTTRGHGTGLGLPHVQAVARAHGIEPKLTSAPGQGSTFAFRFGRSGLAAPPISPPLPTLSGRVLVVDDDEPALLATAQQLRRLGLEVECATSAEAALVSLRGALPDALLTDLSMPIHDGIWLLERLRAEAPALPCVVFTGEITPPRESALAALGIEAVLTKPVEAAELARALEKGVRRA